MGVDWYSCKSCGDTFPDCGDYTYCECGEHWCSDECAEEDGYELGHCKLGKETSSDGYPEEDCEFAVDGSCDTYREECSHWQKTSCKYCRHEDFEDYDLLEFALSQLKISRNDLIELYKTQNK